MSIPWVDENNIFLKCFSCLFGSVVAIAFQNAFRAEMYQNNFFDFLKIIFKISILKRSKTYI